MLLGVLSPTVGSNQLFKEENIKELFYDIVGIFEGNDVNFLNPECWNGGLAVTYDTKSHEIDFIPMVNYDAGIKLAKGKEKEEMMKKFAERSESIKDGI